MNALPGDAFAAVLLFLSPAAFVSAALSCRDWKEAARATFQEWARLWKVVSFEPNVTLVLEKTHELPRWTFFKNQKRLARVGVKELADAIKKELKISFGLGKNEWTIIYFDGASTFATVVESVQDGVWVRAASERRTATLRWLSHELSHSSSRRAN
jgi:hypothetical protein